MRGLLKEAAKRHPELENLRLYIVAVGYPVMGNNMKMVDSPDRAINVRWTALLNRLHSDGIIDAVQEHYYPYASANGGALAWAAHNLHNIISVRRNIANQRLGGYRDPEIAYSMPMEHTEWNVKCWGTPYAETVQPVNAGFEDGLAGWSVVGDGAKAVSWAARRGRKGLRVTTHAGPSTGSRHTFCEVSQVFGVPDGARTFVAGVWVRTDTPDAVRVIFREPGSGRTLGEWGSRVAGRWERVVASAKVLDAAQVELVLRVEGEATAYLDETRLYYTTEEQGQCPISATTFEQQLFCVDAFREMAAGGCPRAHLHHLAGNYPCGAMTSSGEVKDLGRVFAFFAGAYGDRVVRSDEVCEDLPYYSAGNPWATDFNALAPDRTDIPSLGCLASRTDDALYLLLINRTSDRAVRVAIDLGIEPASANAAVRTLCGDDIDLPGAALAESTRPVARRFAHTISPYAAQILRIRLR